MTRSGEMPYLFVYGTLRRDADHPMAGVLHAASTHLGKARFQGRLYRVSWYPAAVPSDDAADAVIGDVFALRPDAVAPLFVTLDDYEGTTPEEGRAAYYRRELHPVVLEDGQVLEAWIYLYNRKVSKLERIDSGDFLNASM